MPRAPRSRGWCFTINNPRINHEAYLAYDCTYMVFQKERGEAGTEHYQGYIYFRNARSLAGIKTDAIFATAHLEAARGTPAANHAYCTKEEGRIDGPWVKGDIPQQGLLLVHYRNKFLNRMNLPYL